MMKKLIIFIAVLLFTSAAAFSQLGTNAQKNWAIGVRLGDPTGLTLKKYFDKNAFEFVAGYAPYNSGYNYGNYYFNQNYNNNGYKYAGATNGPGIAFQFHYLRHFEIKPVEGLQWYVGGGFQFRNYFYTENYYDNSGYYHSQVANYVAAGIDVKGGAEYTFRQQPFTVFADLNFFTAIAEQFGFYPQYGIGGRYNFK
jgi:hypothetical protein